jgi:hypothetical protein
MDIAVPDLYNQLFSNSLVGASFLDVDHIEIERSTRLFPSDSVVKSFISLSSNSDGQWNSRHMSHSPLQSSISPSKDLEFVVRPSPIADDKENSMLEVICRG